MKTMFKVIALVLIGAALLLSTCHGDTETSVIRISFGMEKAAVNIDELVHTITLSGSTGEITLTVEGAGTASAVVAPGLWHIDVKGYFDGVLYSTGSANTEVKPGKTTNVAIQMTVVWSNNQPEKPHDSGIVVTVSPSTVAVGIGQFQSFTAFVEGSEDQTVTWSLFGNTSTGTVIDSSGRLKVDSEEPIGKVLTITAVSAADPTKSGTAEATVSNLPALTGSVTVTGDDWENAELTAVYDTLYGNGTGTATFKWRRNGSEIPEATGATYTVADADRGKIITATVQFSGNTSLVESASHSIQNLTGIYDQAQLAAIGTNAASLGKNYILVNNISLSGNWTPIGSSATPFTGTFDGQNNTISGLTINTTASYQGLFGYVSGGTVKNLGLVGVNIKGGQYTGAVSGFNSGGIIDNCFIVGNVSGDNRIGGVVGYLVNSSIIKNSSFTGNVTSNSTSFEIYGLVGCTGGVVGEAYSATIVNCYATTGIVKGNGTDIGGVVGNLGGYSNIQNCYATNILSSINDDVGGVAGNIWGNSTMQYCFSTGSISGKDYIGGLSGVVQSNSTMHNCAALNQSITRDSGAGVNFGRVTGGDNGSIATLSNNYANSGMSAIGGFTFAGTNTTNDLGGASVNYTPVGTPTPPDAAEETWWSGGIFASVWGTSDSAPWQWNSTDMRPKLYFE